MYYTYTYVYTYMYAYINYVILGGRKGDAMGLHPIEFYFYYT